MLRKNRKGLFKHQFLVLILRDGSICRLDRRIGGEEVNRSGAVTDNGCEAIDSILEIDEYSLLQVEKQSDCLAELKHSIFYSFFRSAFAFKLTRRRIDIHCNGSIAISSRGPFSRLLHDTLLHGLRMQFPYSFHGICYQTRLPTHCRSLWLEQ